MIILKHKGGDIVNKPLITYCKNAEKDKNRIIIPKFIIQQWGNRFYMNIYKNKIELVPVGKEK